MLRPMLLGLLCVVSLWSSSLAGQVHHFHPRELHTAFPNPLKGFKPYLGTRGFPRHEYATVFHMNIPWNSIEDHESDGLERIQSFCESRWSTCRATGFRVIPRVYLDWDREIGNEHWPRDLHSGDYASAAFHRRLERLVGRLGQCWDGDDRVAWVQMGLIGYWGEQHSPSPSQSLQKDLGDWFTAAFRHKPVLVRRADRFTGYEFGIYWDSWAHPNETPFGHGHAGIAKLNREQGRWKTCPIEGETAYNWGKYKIQPGDSPDDTLTDPVHLQYLLYTIRDLHCSALGWIANYSQHRAEVRAGAAEVQKILGYRFVVTAFTCPCQSQAGQEVPFSFTVRNVGSAPLYASWPVEMSLMDSAGKVVCQQLLAGVDTHQWMPGDDWDRTAKRYRKPPQDYVVRGTIRLPATAAAGRYQIGLGIVDPLLKRPGVRFAIEGMRPDFRHPLGWVEIPVTR